MTAIIARGACSALGMGLDAADSGRLDEPAVGRVARDEELANAGLARPYVARAPLDRSRVADDRDHATAMLEYAFAECARELDVALPGWRAMRVGAAIGTSSGGMRSFEELFGGLRGREPRALSATYIGPFAEAARPCAFEPVSLVLGACASSTIAIGLGVEWLEANRCDIALCGGFDAVSVFVAAGFECLRATCGPDGPRPFRAGRDGLALGEAAAIVALVRPSSLGGQRLRSRVEAWITGFGASCDASHLTAPERSGGGLARAANAAIAAAGCPKIELVSAHGTSTAQNDAAEAAALGLVFSTRERTRLSTGSPVPVFSFKGSVGHTLGAAGALEVLATVDALERGIAPASVGTGPIEGGVHVLDHGRPSSARTALKLSSAFGGANAALVISLDPKAEVSARAPREVYLSRAIAVGLSDTDPAALATRSGYAVDRIGRADDLVRLALAAMVALEDDNGGRGSLKGAGIVVGQGLATIETNARFLARVQKAGVSRAEPRRFAYTTPNAAAGECAVAFGLTGPAFAVGGGPHGGIEAIGVAADLVRSGVAERVVVIAADEAGEASARIAPGTKSGAVGLVVDAGVSGRVARLDACTVRFEAQNVEAAAMSPSRLPPMDAHRALLPLVPGQQKGRRGRGRGPDEIAVEIPWGGFAKAKVFWL
jgi:3-oxoacyl-[acyl-carrier-protein] synthase II